MVETVDHTTVVQECCNGQRTAHVYEGSERRSRGIRGGLTSVWIERQTSVPYQFYITFPLCDRRAAKWLLSTQPVPTLPSMVSLLQLGAMQP